MPAISQAFRCFDEVARRGSVRKAAVTLHLTAAAVNQQILNLEAQVGVPLFDRLPRGMQLTTAGELMLAAVRRSQRDFDNALAQVEDLRALRRGHVRVGVSHATAEYLLPLVISSLHGRYPGITFSVRSGTGEELLRGVAQGEIDVAYCLRRPPPPGVQEVRAWPQPLGAVMAPGHPLATEPRLLRLRDCVAYPLILMAPGMELRSMLEQMDSAALHQQRPLVETSSVPMVRRLVAGSTALGFLVPDNVAEDVAAGRLLWRPLHDAGAQLPSCLYQRIGYTRAAAMRLFLDELERVADEMRAGFETGVSWSLKDMAT
ncbi:LysR family transcriptional regulator [Delftia tsuruhatensis]|uniref:LysR family transcriptional regulator n=1 Tax=Delftia tsuruhatensis TaxID=180282 RepID=UPI00064248ED|nr:LysR family transcriptional regulator [Delftia tsuruhatensis]KLO58815.1 LysR family transcriptional regulator [Delftia tsuruhatensis]